MGVRSQPHTTATSPLEKEPSLPIEQEVGWALQLVWIFQRRENISCPCQDLALESFSQQPTHINYTICISYHNGATPLFTLYAFMVCMGTTLHILPRLYLYHKDEHYINKKIPVIPVYLYSCKLSVRSPSCLSQY
jgi:hypothetical protein